MITFATKVQLDAMEHILKGSQASPLNQFNINEIVTLNILSNNSISLTNIGLYIMITSIITSILLLINNNFYKLLTNKTSVSQESIYATVYSVVINQINKNKGQSFFTLMFTLFIFILTNNLVGMIPYNFSTTAQFMVTFFVSFSVVIGATILGIIEHAFQFFSVLVAQGCPLLLLYLLVLIESISYLARCVSLGLRLAANVLSGHMLLNILSGFTYKIMKSGPAKSVLSLFPLSFVAAFSALEMAIAFIQAQVFIVLSSSYTKDGVSLH